MKKLIWLADSSLDSFMAGPRGELDWAAASMDDEAWDYVNELLGIVDTVLFGRVTYQQFETYWPAVLRNSGPKNELDFSRWIENVPKAVASRTLKNLAWKHSNLISGDIPASIAKMKQQPGKNILIFGSSNLAASLWNARLIDELRLRIHPVLLRNGQPLFADGTQPSYLTLLDSRMLKSGVVTLRYDLA